MTLDWSCFNPDLRALETREDNELNESSLFIAFCARKRRNPIFDEKRVERRDICREYWTINRVMLLTVRIEKQDALDMMTMR